VTVGNAQLPLPSQLAADFLTPLAQLALAHCVPVLGKSQAVGLVPQVPPQVPDPAHAVRLPCGAPLTCVQVPLVMSQAWHWPSQPELQQ
jgi:hypothetical protein